MQTGRIRCKVVAGHPGLWERDTADTVFYLRGPLPQATDPSLPRTGENCTSCRRKNNSTSNRIATMDLDQLMYLCLLYSGKVLLRTTLHVISEDKPQEEMMYLQHQNLFLQTLKHVPGKHCRNSLARRWQWSQSVQSNLMSSNPLFLTLLSTDQTAS